MPPPMSSMLTFESRCCSTPIFELILAPPMIAASGRFGIADDAPEIVDLLLHQEAGDGGEELATPAVDAWARCAVPKASFT